MSRADWRKRFDAFAARLAPAAVYVTIDIDCVRGEEAATNWESGLFTADDLVWALQRLRRSAEIVGGDLCGAYSPPVFARRFQRLASRWDHPKLPPVTLEDARARNMALLRAVWPALAG
jgi:hypothetical protein